MGYSRQAGLLPLIRPFINKNLISVKSYFIAGNGPLGLTSDKGTQRVFTEAIPVTKAIPDAEVTFYFSIIEIFLLYITITSIV
jgi:hypothetical protein